MAELSGSELKAQREALHIALEQVAQETRIRLSILQDLEEEEYAELSSSAQIKGFLSLYASYLTSQWIALGIGESPDSENQKTKTEQQSAPSNAKNEENLQADAGNSPNSAPALKSAEDTPAVPQKPAPIPDPISTSDLSPDKPESESQKILAQIGREIASRRRYLNLGWDVIVQQTRLKQATLKALESGQLEAFSTPLEFRKDLQSYTRFLNLDVESVMIQFAEALQKRRFENAPKKRKIIKPSKPASTVLIGLRKFFTLDLFFGTFLILGILAFLIWGISNMSQRGADNPQPTETLPGIIDFILTTPTAAEAQQTPVPDTEEILEIPTATAFFIQTIPEEGFRLTLHARQNLWIRIYSDDDLDYEGRLASGEVRSFSAKTSLTLETGNISVLEIAFQGNALEPIYRAFGTPARLYFDENGMQELPVLEPTPTSDAIPTPSELTPGAP